MRIVLVAGLVLMAACSIAVPLPPNRAESLTVSRPIEGVTISAAPAGYSGWRFIVDNRRDEQLLLRWDESSFVASDGVSRGRFVRSSTKLLDVARPQTSSPIARRAKLIEVALPEGLIGFKPREEQQRLGEKQPALSRDQECRADLQRCTIEKRGSANCQRELKVCMTIPHEGKGDAPPAVRKGVGRLVLVFESARGRETWEAWVSFDGTQPPAESKPETPEAPLITPQLE